MIPFPQGFPNLHRVPVEKTAPRGVGSPASTVRTGMEVALGPHLAVMEPWLFPRLLSAHILPLLGAWLNTSEEIRLPHIPEDWNIRKKRPKY